MEDLAGVGSAGQDGVIAQHLGVAEGRSGLELAGYLADGGVDVDDQPGRPGPGAHGPGPAQRVARDGFELADVAEGEGAQERAQRGRCHHPVGKHTSTGPRAQHLGVIDVRTPDHHGMHQGQHLAPRPCSADASTQANSGVDQGLQAEANPKGAHQQQASIGDEIRVIEAHLDAIKIVRYSTH